MVVRGEDDWRLTSTRPRGETNMTKTKQAPKATKGEVVVKLLNGSSVAHVGTVSRMGDPHDVTVIVESQGMTFEAWDLERDGDCFLAPSWKRLS
jgi:hypothetical protein